MSGSRPCGPPARSALSRTAFATAGTSGRSTPSGRAAAAHSPRSPRRRLSRRWPRCPGDAACDCRGRWPPRQDPARHLRVLLEPGPDGQHRDPRSRPLCLGEQLVGHRCGPLTMEGERRPGPVTWPVYDLRAELHLGAARQAHRRRRCRRCRSRTAAAGGHTAPSRARAPRQADPVATAPPRSKNSRRSMDTPRRLLTLGQPRRTHTAANVRTRTSEEALSQSVVNWKDGRSAHCRRSVSSQALIIWWPSRRRSGWSECSAPR